ncbi:hypothetical protein DZF91_06980 [Actinomadura logoneensis]|uniref:Uncharacterized protein n=1 Tax=Actinomadura logoneensis TaxID=2293572 RepID=A0A372JRD8_9ACTN|nr:hypothetical protein [Actinomadura logoneensis]RFU42356.1 hypothetical protein DZF91_06980 [Actinomadura logoneensis]
MGYGVIRTPVVGGVLAVSAAALLVGCGGALGGGGNSAATCDGAKKAYERYIGGVRAVSAADAAQWRQPTEQLAASLAGLADKASDARLRDALKDQATKLRAAAGTVSAGDVEQLNEALAAAPDALGTACR